VYGSLSLWIEGVEQVESLVDRQRFDADPAYARHVAHVNILGVLIQHRDGRLSNYLIAKPPAEARVFSIDNGIAFGPRVFNFFMRSLNVLRVPSLPRDAVERLRAVKESQVEALGVLGELAPDEAGVLVAAPPGTNLDPDEGTRRSEGGHVQYGLTHGEIEGVAERLEDLLEGVDQGEIGVR
jgi:hypothetical protein